jgi:hypothetical protein
MTEFKERIKALLFAGAAAVAGVALVGAGVSQGDSLVLAGGVAALVGAAALVAISSGVLRRFGNAPGHSGPALKHLWRAPEKGTAPPPASDQEITAVERTLGRPLPALYKRMLKLQNGGDLRYPLWVSSDPTGKQLAYFAIYSLSGTAAHDSLARTPQMVREGLLPKGLACLLDDQEWDLCLDYRKVRHGEEPQVVALDEERTEHALAATMGEFVRGLTRDLPHHIYAAQGTVGPHADMQLASLNESLGVALATTDSRGDEYRAEYPPWRSATRTEPAVLRLIRNGCDRDHTFPETWSKWVLCCDIALEHREELERRLRKTDFRWVLLHSPPRRLVEAGFFGSVAPPAKEAGAANV